MRKFLIGLAASCLTSAAQGAIIPGFSDVTDNGDGSFTFVFDTSVSDSVASGLSFSNGAGLGFEVTALNGALPASVIQSKTGSGGLGVPGDLTADTLGIGETLLFSFNQEVKVLSFRLNDRFDDAATGGFTLRGDVSTLHAPASNFDGVGIEAFGQGRLCPEFTFLCDTTGFSAEAGTFNGYVESITIEATIPPVPLPASMVFLLAGITGFGAIGRKRASLTS